MTPVKPSLELLRSLSDEHVLRALMDAGRLTRAELAALAGISKPTVSESMRRLTASGLVVDTGERTTGRGRIGTYYGLSPSAGTALAIDIAPSGVVAERLDAHGTVLARAARPVERPASAEGVAAALVAVARELTGGASGLPGGGGPVRVAAVSAADPVDRGTGRLVHLPDAPFLVGDLDPVQLLAPYVTGPVTVDNDVNWAARAEHAGDDFVYVYLGEGLGCAVVSAGEVLRGHAGFAGEIAHLITTGPGGRAMPFTDVFAALRLRRPDSTAIHVPSLLAAAPGVLPVIGTAVAGVLAAAVALADPALVVLGGPWGSHPPVLQAVRTAFAGLPRHVPVRAAARTDHPSLAGARTHALHALRAAIVTAASS
ncbi:ROK family transcriptional regulator [Dactylosporangium aurantiacum]|uniref:ROK family transcriptional regulator n=1 Tax=Dactylosporangium aurantiacum TaxID=35754 RepID=A0A9Q9I8H1_9ACTN|nr:ROK family transcriptional regulator [Dactylosporangium aurantiacum]MDG6105182.1 ROK family transcriptional regulator [Dactylosporangium aurantiacum]UWZ51704.1 ROK family transcriptional regulator [Dactylosporangium aurantiacum]